ncbi:MAG: type II toxin-antitoxin system mRNA interferase toxin, RelE/StbE family [Elusimicrobia bacterium]|nr:type II toxin-antitoxin system mRNA interferase toxin, RelE/StbE family [Elusimicrobiota bacterium]
MTYEIRITHQAKKDIEQLAPKLKNKLYAILTTVIAENPYVGKKLLGELAGSYSYRLTFKDRIVCSIDDKKKTVYIERAKTHYGD